MRQLLVALSTVALLSGVVFTGVALAHDACSHGSLVLYENANLQSDAGGGPLTVCLDDDDFEFGYPGLHTFPGLCNAPINNDDDWNDCISSLTVSLVADHCVTLYNGASFSQAIVTFDSLDDGSYNLSGFGANDSLTSVNFWTAASC